MASVNKWIRWPDRSPPERGGHVVLVTGGTGARIRLHNPSGLPGGSQRDAWVAVADFTRFYAGQGPVISG
jgi:hypothetical protein